jgi:hypothetical protein
VFKSVTRLGGSSAVVLALVATVGWAQRAEGRMTVIYDIPTSVATLTAVQADGSPGLTVADGLFQQVAGPLPADRQLGSITGGVGTTATPSVRDLSAPAIASLIRGVVDLAGARIAFIDIGPDFNGSGPDGVNLGAAMQQLAATPFATGGSYADRVQMYISPFAPIADPENWAPFWHAMSLTGGVWIEAYHGRVQWSPEHWLAWPRVVRDGLIARGLDTARIHMIVRGADQAATWANLRVGVACELLANGPGGYRIEDHLGFVREFRATFGTAPAPAGPSPVACAPTPVLPEPRASQLAEVLALDGVGAPIAGASLLPRSLRTGKLATLKVSLGPDPLGLAARIGADRGRFWAAAQGRLTVRGAGINASTPLLVDGSATLAVTPTADGAIALGLIVDGAAIRQAIGAPVDLAVSLAPYRTRIEPVLRRVIAQPTTWQLTIPLTVRLASGPAPPRLSYRVLRRNAPPKSSRIELTLSRRVTRLLVEVGVVRRGRYERVRRLRITGTRVAIATRLPKSGSVRVRVVAGPLV